MLSISTDDSNNKLTCHIILPCNNLKQNAFEIGGWNISLYLKD